LQWEDGTWRNDSWPNENAFGSGLAVTSWTAGRLDIFGLDGVRSLYHNSFDGGGSQGAWDSLRGVCRSRAVAVSYAPYRLDVVVVGDLSIINWRSWDTQDGWSEWAALGTDTDPVVKFHGTPALVSWGPERLDLFALSDDDFLYHLAYANGVWDSTWTDLGSVEANSPPVAVSWGADRLDVFFTTRDSTVMHLGWNGSDWKTWDSLGQLEVAGATSTSSDDVHNPSTTSSAGTTSSTGGVDVEEQGLTTGALVGIVVGCVVAGALMFGGFFWYWFRRRSSSRARLRAENPPPPLASNENDIDPTVTAEKKKSLHGDERHELAAGGGMPELDTQERRELDAGDFHLPELYDRDVRH
jgi:hypothetical protein